MNGKFSSNKSFVLLLSFRPAKTKRLVRNQSAVKPVPRATLPSCSCHDVGGEDDTFVKVPIERRPASEAVEDDITPSFINQPDFMSLRQTGFASLS